MDESFINRLSINASTTKESPINCLPNEILYRIFESVTKKDRKQIAQVCTKFYQIICNLDKLDRIGRFDCGFLNIPKIFSYMLSSQRRFRRVRVDITHYNISRIKALLDILSDSIESILIDVSIDAGDDLISILKKLPNVVNLCIILRCLNISNCQIQKDTILPKLKRLKLCSVNQMTSIGNLLNFLPENVLRDLEIHTSCELYTLIANQAKSIVDLKICEELCDSSEIFRQLKLKSCLIFCSGFDTPKIYKFLLPFIQEHPELEKIEILIQNKRSCVMIANGELLKALFGMKNLSSICFYVSDDNWSEIMKLIKSSKMKNIELDIFLDDEKLRIFFNEKFDNVTKIKFFHSNTLTADLCQNWKQLTKLELNGKFDDHEIVKLNNILDGLPNLKYLSCSKHSIFGLTDRIYPEIIAIQIENLKTPVVHLLNALPNLQILELHKKLNPRLIIEVLRKIISMELREIKIKLKIKSLEIEDETTKREEEELLVLFELIFQKISNVEITLSEKRKKSIIEKVTAHRFEDFDYFYGKINLFCDYNCLKLNRTYPINVDFPFDCSLHDRESYDSLLFEAEITNRKVRRSIFRLV